MARLYKIENSFFWQILLFIFDKRYRVVFLLVRPKNDQVALECGIFRTGPPKKRLRVKKVKVPELVLLYSRNSSNTLIFSVNIY